MKFLLLFLSLFSQSQVDSIFSILSDSEGQDITLMVYPGVYWLDNPDNPEVQMNPHGEGTPYAKKINCRSLRIIGVDRNPQNTVFAVNRGQTQGAIGNYTMLSFSGSKLYSENITYGNYCNVDLVYPRDTTLNRRKRSEAIVQAQLAHCHGTDTVVARNCRFISRLNLCNFTGARYAEFDSCYMECTDDALAGNSLYRHCNFTFFSSKPFYHSGKGTVFEDCDIDILTTGTQFFTKTPSPVTLKDVRLYCDHPINLAWCRDNNPDICSATNVTLNGRKAKFDSKHRRHTIEKLELLSGSKRVGDVLYTFDAYEPKDTRFYNWVVDSSIPSWYYGTAYDAAEGYKGYVQNQKGARLIIEPLKTTLLSSFHGKKRESIQSISFTACPCKSAGQGFGSALGQYLDVCVAMDKDSLNGFALRIQRTPDYSNAVAVSFVKYQNGEATHLTTPQKCELFHSPCKIKVAIDNSKLIASLRYKNKILNISAIAKANTNAKAMILQHTGSVGSSATLIKDIKVKW